MIMIGILKMLDKRPNTPLHDHAALKALDLAHHMPAQTDYGLREDLGGSRMMVAGQGCRLWDADGKTLLDGMAGLWCVGLGYGRAELAEAAFHQMKDLAFYNTFFKTATPPPVLLSARLAEKLSLTGANLSHVFFNSSGSEANDTIFRLVRHYWEGAAGSHGLYFAYQCLSRLNCGFGLTGRHEPYARSRWASDRRDRAYRSALWFRSAKRRRKR